MLCFHSVVVSCPVLWLSNKLLQTYEEKQRKVEIPPNYRLFAVGPLLSLQTEALLLDAEKTQRYKDLHV